MSKYYFNGGIYFNGKSHPVWYQNRYLSTVGEYEFEAVHPTHGLPYITTSEEGIKHTEHHSSVYQISDDFKTAILIKNHNTVQSPAQVELTIELSDKLRKAVKEFEMKIVSK